MLLDPLDLHTCPQKTNFLAHHQDRDRSLGHAAKAHAVGEVGHHRGDAVDLAGRLAGHAQRQHAAIGRAHDEDPLAGDAVLALE